MRNYKRLYEIVDYCKEFKGWFFEYLTDGIVGGDETVMNLLEEYAEWSDRDQNGQGFTAWSEND